MEEIKNSNVHHERSFKSHFFLRGFITNPFETVVAKGTNCSPYLYLMSNQNTDNILFSMIMRKNQIQKSFMMLVVRVEGSEGRKEEKSDCKKRMVSIIIIFCHHPVTS